MKPAFLTYVDVRSNPDGKTWTVLEPVTYRTGKGNEITVPRGFVTDFASIPKLPLVRFVIGSPATGLHRDPAVIHDWLYYSQPCSRKEADDTFREAMKLKRVPFWKRPLMYHYVRSLGWVPWNNYRLKRERKEQNGILIKSLNKEYLELSGKNVSGIYNAKLKFIERQIEKLNEPQ